MKNLVKAIIFMTAVVTLSNVDATAAPSNDDWQNSALITGATGSKQGSTLLAGTQTCEPTHIFPDDPSSAPQRTVWYKWIAPESGSYTFYTASSGQHTLSAYVMVLSICNGNVTTLPASIIENVLFSVPGSPQPQARVTFPAVAGGTYFLAVDGWDPGDFVLQWQPTKYRYNAQLDSQNQGSDVVITRDNGSNTEWWFERNFYSGSYRNHGAMVFGRTTDKKLLGDFNGDGLTDFAAVRPENGQLTWWIVDRAGNLLKVIPFGLDSDRPIAGDYDGDGIGDIAVTRVEASGQKTWHILGSKIGYRVTQFGIDGDHEMIGDYDGDGKTDVAVIRLVGTDYIWYILRSQSNQVMIRQFGHDGDVPQVGDVDNDGKSDIVIFRRTNQFEPQGAGYWYVVRSSAPNQGIMEHQFGQANDIPQMGDHDGDGLTDWAVFRQGTWWFDPSLQQSRILGFGYPTDHAVVDLNIANAFLGN
jgi:hypothetical protein